MDVPQLLNPAPTIFHGWRSGRLAEPNSRAGRVEQADSLVGQLPTGDITRRKLHGIDQGLVEDANVVMFFQGLQQATQHDHGVLFAGLFDANHLKSSGQGRVLFEVLLVFSPSGGRDCPQLAAGQGGL